MEILDIRPRWGIGYANSPTLEVLIDKRPEPDQLLYRVTPVDGGTYYWAEQDGYVSFYFHQPRDQTGFGGRTFNLNVIGGRVHSIKGPWSSRTGVVNRYFKHSTEVSFTDDPKAWERGFTFFGGAMLVEKLRPALAKLRPGIELRDPTGNRELAYEVACVGMPLKNDTDYRNSWGDVTKFVGGEELQMLLNSEQYVKFVKDRDARHAKYLKDKERRGW